LGGKFSLLPWLLPLLPECNHFVDCCGGSGVVALNRKPSPIETYNDINYNLYNFFRVLREDPEKLITLLELTPHSRYEYDQAWDDPQLTRLDRARNFFIRTQQSIYAAGAQDKTKGWTMALTQSRCSISEKTNKWLTSVNGLWEVVERMKHMQIECKDFRYVLKNYDSPGTLFYVDPPYDREFRSSTKYEFEFHNQDFYDLHHWAKKVKGKIAISGYDSEFMKDLFKDFTYHQGPVRKNTRAKSIARECLWTNYSIE
jgi:DNA adenine methylase